MQKYQMLEKFFATLGSLDFSCRYILWRISKSQFGQYNCEHGTETGLEVGKMVGGRE